MSLIPDYLAVPPEERAVASRSGSASWANTASVADDMARTMAACVREAQAAGRGATLIVPVGPVDQFPSSRR